MVSYYDLSVDDAPRAWRGIRTVRSEPPESIAGVLSNSNRRNEFHMGLEQAQQQYSAARVIGYESRALNLFYGLSQAGRALAACSPNLHNSNWNGTGHGLKFNTNLEQGLFGSKIQNQGGGESDLFSRVSTAIGSPFRIGAAELGSIVVQLLDYDYTFKERNIYPSPLSAQTLLSGSGQPQRIELDMPTYDESVDRRSMTDVQRLFSAYPGLTGFKVQEDHENPAKPLASNNTGKCFLSVPNDRQCYVDPRTGNVYPPGVSDYRGTKIYLPCTGDTKEPIRPVMAWWLVLFSLSMVARYAPSKWMKVLSIQDSQIASKVEFLLDAALDAVPDLLHLELAALSKASTRQGAGDPTSS